ncbi:excalibur calcium-binding domain-containing protein [Caulobacter sp. 17J80-11]|uniref:excalibur calcium-binding domain-containing protein n=1 Tax=Caulobacter sp. 17J80-11 TaxID=2763502 RepID=UPI001653DD04|nr:excalibur calcium-binding domain-containing protein [Caulobacter sp. 17J80-11]MBC6982905.1 excalibur calcium-binding domain-containing protein [Caulobacter sp. 17J80-11]
MWRLGVLASVLLLGVPAAPAVAHPGGLNSEGCHHNRKTGDYHCHRKPSARPAAPSQSSSGRSGGGTPSYPNCAAARAAGAAPVYRGQPGYGPHLDRDNDGIGCE